MSEFDIDVFLKSPEAVALRHRFAGRRVNFNFSQEWKGVPNDLRREVADRLVADGVWRFETEVRDIHMERPYFEESGEALYIEGWKMERVEDEEERTGTSYAWCTVEPVRGQRGTPPLTSWTVSREVYSCEEPRVYPVTLGDQIGAAVLAKLGYGQDAPSISKAEAEELLAQALLYVGVRPEIKD